MIRLKITKTTINVASVESISVSVYKKCDHFNELLKIENLSITFVLLSERAPFDSLLAKEGAKRRLKRKSEVRMNIVAEIIEIQKQKNGNKIFNNSATIINNHVVELIGIFVCNSPPDLQTYISCLEDYMKEIAPETTKKINECIMKDLTNNKTTFIISAEKVQLILGYQCPWELYVAISTSIQCLVEDILDIVSKYVIEDRRQAIREKDVQIGINLNPELYLLIAKLKFNKMGFGVVKYQPPPQV